MKLGQQTRDMLQVTEGLGEGEAVVLGPRNTEAPSLAAPRTSHRDRRDDRRSLRLRDLIVSVGSALGADISEIEKSCSGLQGIDSDKTGC